ncbi:MAG TPA: Rieske 2Fe-2S domain-containing protein, partial [Candidatus Dormibacteraeota bacterium]|nr:Rieske 2Fe-2S domain-containing protein [Candidatus Dormibacteraeota bacterium]
AAGAAGGAILGRATGPRTSKLEVEAIEPLHAVWTDVGSINDMVEGQGKRVVAGGVSAFVFRRGQEVTAVSAVCSHLPCDLAWDNNEAHLVCSCHPARFTADGQAMGSYGLSPLNRVHVRVTAAGRIEVMGTL